MLKFFNLEYETDKAGTRKVNLICNGQDDAIGFINKINNNQVKRFNNLGTEFDVHAYTDYAVDYLNKKLSVKKTSDNIQTENTSQTTYICPWCDKPFEKASALKAHMNRSHNVKEVKE